MACGPWRSDTTSISTPWYTRLIGKLVALKALVRHRHLVQGPKVVVMGRQRDDISPTKKKGNQAF